jgi:hypothetical protein
MIMKKIIAKAESNNVKVKSFTILSTISRLLVIRIYFATLYSIIIRM